MMDCYAVARLAHEVNRAYCVATGDTSQIAWEEAPDWQRHSAVNGVDFLRANPNAGPEASHENWMREKIRNGWVYGEIKNPDAKTHPCLVPFGDLPQSQRVKDFLFHAIVKACA